MGSQLCPTTHIINYTIDNIVQFKHSRLEQVAHYSFHQPEAQVLNAQKPEQEEKNIEGQGNEIEDLGEQGELILPQGASYKGNLKDGVPHGYGEEIHNNGDKFIGEFVNGFKKQGIYEFSNGEKYIGTFQEGMMSGKGKFFFPNGDSYYGDFKSNSRYGRGLYIPRQPNRFGIKYFQGQYVNGQREGEGTIYFEEGHQLTGYFRNGIFEGRLSQ